MSSATRKRYAASHHCLIIAGLSHKSNLGGKNMAAGEASETSLYQYEVDGDIAIVRLADLPKWILTDPVSGNAIRQVFSRVRVQQKKVLFIHSPPGLLSPERVDAFWQEVDAKYKNRTESPQVRALQHNFNELLRLFLEMDAFIVTTIQGKVDFNLLGLLMISDYRLCAEDGMFVNRVLDQGVPPGSALVWFLARFLGGATTSRLLMNEQSLPAREALDLGLIHALSSSDKLEEEALAVARRLASKPHEAIRSLKRALRHIGSDLDTYLQKVGSGFTQSR
jgi:enoyl-CoA hydratase/carnithine racemase